MRFPVDEIWVEKEAEESYVTRRILGSLNSAKVLRDVDIAAESARIDMNPDPFVKGKKVLKLVNYKGAFVKSCPGTKTYLCCGLKILNIGQGCPIDCRYCALQVYFNNPVMEVYVNFEEMLNQLKVFLACAPPDHFFRFCTGEFTDSLALDDYTGYSVPLAETFSGRNNATLEFKTKTDFIEPLLRLENSRNIILSFSVNAPGFSKSEEIRAISLRRRLIAAGRSASHGFKVGFHFDPIVPFDGWEGEYSKTIDAIFDAVRPASIAWISMGVLRFVPDLKDVVTSRFGPVRYFYDSFAPGLDGKLRLSRNRRTAIYRSLAQKIRSYSTDVLIYLCMESNSIWRESLGLDVRNNDQLIKLLDDAAKLSI
ncbi:MAG: radical SAM protein [Desulfomonilaceae bacterium]